MTAEVSAAATTVVQGQGQKQGTKARCKVQE